MEYLNHYINEMRKQIYDPFISTIEKEIKELHPYSVTLYTFVYSLVKEWQFQTAIHIMGLGLRNTAKFLLLTVCHIVVVYIYTMNVVKMKSRRRGKNFLGCHI